MVVTGLQTFRNASWHPLQTLQVYRNGAWRRLKTLKVYSGGAWRLIGNFVQPLTLNAPDAVAGGYDSVQTASSTATPAGGLAPYSYSWSKVSGTTMTVSGATTATAGFLSPTLSVGETVTAVYRCTCTDSAAQTATKDINVTFAFIPPPH